MAIGKRRPGEGGAGARPGCTLLGAALGMFCLVAGMSLWSLVSQDRAIAKFTRDVEEPTEIAEGTEEEVAVLKGKLAAFAEGARRGDAVELALTVEDLNLIIAHFERGREFRGMVYFTGFREVERSDEEASEADGGRVHGRQIVGAVCLTMNRLKFWKKRYLVGEMEFDLRPVPAGLDLIVTGVRVPGKEVPGQFVGGFANWHWLAPYHDDPALKPVLESVTEVEIGEERILLRTGK